MRRFVPFNNSSIRAPKVSKPHIVFKQGYWRVSTNIILDKSLYFSTRNKWDQAHYVINQWNHQLHA